MEKTKIKLLIITLFICINCLNAQKTEISLGQKCPDVMMEMVNFKTNNARISDFKGKLLILDFWATFCAPCVSFMRTADSLELQFGDKLQILPVTYENGNKIIAFMNKMKKANKIVPTSVVNDRELSQYFKHNTIPHEVWIDEDGIVRAITSQEQVNSKNIQMALNKIYSFLPFKKDDLRRVDYTRPVFVGASQIKEEQVEFIYNNDSSALLHYINFGGAFKYLKGNRVTAYNQGIYNLCLLAYTKGEINYLNRGRYVLEVKDNRKYRLGADAIGNEWEKWAPEHCYSYELILPNKSNYDGNYDPALLQTMQRDIEKNFGIVGSFEKRKIKCLVLKKISSENLIKKADPYSQPEENIDNFSYHLKNGPLKNFVWRLSSYYLQNLEKPILDETGYENVDLDLNAQMSNLNLLNIELQKVGLKLEDAEREMEVVVLREKGTN